MKTIADLVTALQQGTQPVVTFQGSVGDLESYAEAGMRARILSATNDGADCVKLMFDFEEFDGHNRAFESANYYDKNKVPCLTAREAGYYKPQEKLYFAPTDDIETYMVFEDSAALGLFDEFKAQGVSGTYVQWLESQLLAARA